MKLFWRILYPVLITTLMTAVVLLFLPEADSLTIGLLSTLCSIPILGGLYFRDRKRQGLSAVSMTPVHILLVVLFGIAGCFFANNLITISHLGDLFPGYLQVSEQLYAPPFCLQLLAVGMVIPIGEELIFRGLAFGRLRGAMGFFPAAIFSSLFFGIYHGNVVQGVYACLLGLAMCLAYEAYGTLAAPVLFHMAANLSSVLMTKFGVGEDFGAGISFYLITAVSGCVTAFAVYQIEKRRKIH